MITDRDLGFNAIIHELKQLDGKEVKAGVLKDAGDNEGVPLVNIAFWNEYGTRRIPSRPFVRIASDENKNKWGNVASDGVGQIIERRIKWRKCCGMVGEQMKGDIKKVIGDKSKLAPNAPSTIRRKGHDKPLIETGLMKSKVDFRID